VVTEFTMRLRDGAPLVVTQTGPASWSSERRTAGSANHTWLGGNWADLNDLAAMMRTSRPEFARLCRETFGVVISPDYDRETTAWTYDSEQAVPEKYVASDPARCDGDELHVVSWDRAMDMGEDGGAIGCLNCGRTLSIRAKADVAATSPPR
jgi:hypothetical protein